MQACITTDSCWRDAKYPHGMPLQADPTIKFAWKRFDLKRIYNNLLSIHSPYNTYKNPGLPPGPIRIPSVAGIDAVLNRVQPQLFIYVARKKILVVRITSLVHTMKHMKECREIFKSFERKRNQII